MAPIRWGTVTDAPPADSVSPSVAATAPGDLPAALLWDMDGTLVDTEPYWMDSETELIESFGGTWTRDDGLSVVGMGLWDSARVFQSRGVPWSEDEIVSWMTTRVMERAHTSMPWRPGARELLAEARQRGIPTAMVTMSVHRMAAQIADAAGFDAFDEIVGGDDVSDAKPHPAPYLTAAERLGVDIRQCVAFEDSIPGVTSASASGAVTIAVPLHAAIAESDRYTVWPSLEGRRLDDVLALFRQRRAAHDETAEPEPGAA